MNRASAPRPARTQLRVGRLTKAHGLKGGMKIELYTDEPDRRFVPDASFSLQVPTSSAWHGKSIRLAELRWYNGHPVVFFQDVADREAAESLVKAILWVDQDLAELPVEDNAWYDHQLVGLSAVRDGRTVGRIIRVDHLPGQDLLVVRSGETEVLVPFVSAIVPEVDIRSGIITLTPPEGLFEDVPEPSAANAESADPDRPDDPA